MAAVEQFPGHQAMMTERGFSDPVRLLSVRDAHWLSRYLQRVKDQKPPDWEKARAVIDPTLFNLARSETILDLLRPHLGNDIVLWGVNRVLLRPRHKHAWHVDIETGLADGPCISVWVGLRNSTSKSGLSLVPCSHRWGDLLQQCAASEGIKYGSANDDTVLNWARRFDPSARLFTPEVGDGEAIFMDGRIWHCSKNNYLLKRRHAVVLQYAPADVAIRIPDMGKLDWPFRLKAAPTPKTILVSGRSQGSRNRIVPPPPMKYRDLTSLSTHLHQYQLPLAEDPEKGWKPYDPFFAQTASLELLGYHTSVLSPGQCPHPPHKHPEEEFLIVLEGEAEIVLADSPRDQTPTVKRLTRHQASYYPAQQHHTIRNASADPVTYLMLRWRSARTGSKWPLATRTFDLAGAARKQPGRGLSVHVLADEPTGLLSKLHIHLSELSPGHGYEPHVDAYDLAMLVLDGEIEILGATAGPNSMVLIAAGEPHGIFNSTDRPAKYLVLELHTNSGFSRDMPPWLRKSRKLASRGMRLLQRVRRKLKSRS